MVNLPNVFVFGWEIVQHNWARHVLRCFALPLSSRKARREDLQRQESSLKERLLSEVVMAV